MNLTSSFAIRYYLSWMYGMFFIIQHSQGKKYNFWNLIPVCCCFTLERRQGLFVTKKILLQSEIVKF